MADTQRAAQSTIVPGFTLFASAFCAFDREKAVTLGWLVPCDAPMQAPPSMLGRRGWYRCLAGHGHFVARVEDTTCWRVSTEGLAWDFLEAHLAAHASATRLVNCWTPKWTQAYAAVLTERGYGAAVRQDGRR
jgi:hypothetical protein